jgi:hypothetical protein
MWDNSIAAKKERRIDTKKTKKKSTTVLDMTLWNLPNLKKSIQSKKS